MNRFQQQHHALGSEVFLTLVTEKDEASANRLFDRLLKHITTFERQFSRFLPDSELTRFNQQSGRRTAVSPSFARLLRAAKSLAEQTDGLYNPFVLPALQRAGYLGSWPKPEADLAATNFTARKLVTVSELDIGDSWAKIPETAALDFGGIGKGYLLDELAKMLDTQKLTGYWLSLGGDIICSGHDLDNRQWQVTVQSAVELDKNVQTIANQQGHKLAIATSGVTKRQGIKNGQAWHHIIDPRTGQPADTNILTVTVTAEKAANADVYAKCIVIAGAEQAEKYKTAGVIKLFLLQTAGQTATMTGKGNGHR